MPDLSLVELVAEAAELGIPISALREATASAAMAADEQGAFTLPPAPAIDSEGETEAGDEDGSYWDTWCARGRPNAKHANWPDMSARRDPDAGYGPGASRVGRIVII